MGRKGMKEWKKMTVSLVEETHRVSKSQLAGHSDQHLNGEDKNRNHRQVHSINIEKLHRANQVGGREKVANVMYTGMKSVEKSIHSLRGTVS